MQDYIDDLLDTPLYVYSTHTEEEGQDDFFDDELDEISSF